MSRFWEYLYQCSASKPSLNQDQKSQNRKCLETQKANQILNLLTNTKSEERIPSAVPAGIKVAHKTGTWSQTGSWHDCGIVFAKNPTIICIMSENTTYEEAVKLIKKVTEAAVNSYSS